MAKKKNRGKKSTGTKSSSAAASENQSQHSSVGDKINTVKTEETGPTGNHKSENASVGLPRNAAGKDGCGHHSSAQTDQGAFLSEFETKALQVATQTAQSPEPKIVEKVVEVVKYVEKEVKVEDPALKLEVEKLSKENAELKSQVANLQEDSEAAAGDGERVKELQNEIASVNEKVAHYQTVLADTESLLKSLQASVESEEVAWKKRLSDKEKDLHQLVADKANLQLQVKQLEDTIDKVKQAEDIQEKLKSLQEQLQAEEKEKVSLLEKLQEAQEQLAKTATQTSSTNGPASEEQCQEDDSLQDDTASLVSASSASVTDPNFSQSEAPTKKPKKKRKGLLGKLMG